eukprot:2096752-Pyramimonas_sp.AAC.1
MIKTRQRKATRAGKRAMFGNVVTAKAEHPAGPPREGPPGRVLRAPWPAPGPAQVAERRAAGGRVEGSHGAMVSVSVRIGGPRHV